MFAFADPLWPRIKVKVIEASMSRHAMHTSSHAKFGYYSLNTVRDMGMIV